MVNEKSYLLASRALKSKDVIVRVQRDTEVADDFGISAQMPFEDFLAQLVVRIGNPAGMITRAQLDRRVRAAAQEVVELLKAETARVPHVV